MMSNAERLRRSLGFSHAADPADGRGRDTFVGYDLDDAVEIRRALLLGAAGVSCPRCGTALRREEGRSEAYRALACDRCRRCVVVRASAAPPDGRRAERKSA